MKRVTVHDVAQATGFSTSTVSRVLNRRFEQHRFAPQTIKEIRGAADRLGYRPSGTARALRSGKTMLVGMVVADIANPFFGELAVRVEAHLREADYHLLVCNTSEDPQQQAAYLTDMVSRGVDGLIVSPSGPLGCMEVVQAGVPMVTIDRPLAHPELPHVGLDNVQAGRMLGQHLRRLGYHCVGVVMPHAETDPTLADRLYGLQDGLEPEGRVMWIESLPSPLSQRQAADAVLKRIAGAATLPEVLVGLVNTATLGALEAVSQRQMAVPEVIGITGIDDFVAATIVSPPVSLVAQPVEQIAAAASEALIHHMEQPGQDPETTLIEPILRSRQSLRLLKE